jgi:peptidoglycan LD-endopeptidase LytH
MLNLGGDETNVIRVAKPPMIQQLARIKPGWYVLGFLLVYSIAISVAFSRTQRAQAQLRTVLERQVDTPVTPTAPEGLWFPVVGARLPQDPAYLPNATRAYRRGVNQGFDFYSEDAGIPIAYGTPVIASDNGVISRIDSTYTEISPNDWLALIDAVSQDGADDEQLNLLRGRQIWITTDNDLRLIYGHLSDVRSELQEGSRVYRGQVIGYVGNSGTDDGVNGTTRGARLHFEIWRADGSFIGQGMNEAQVRSLASSLFVGP